VDSRLTFMPAIYTDSQIPILKGTRTPAFEQIRVIEESYCYSSVRGNSAYRRSCNVPSIMDKGAGQGEYILLEFGRITNIV
jgi:hypothetical protein